MHHPRGARQTRCRPPCESCWMRVPKTSVAHPCPPRADERIDGPAQGVRAQSAGRSQLVHQAPFGGLRGVPGGFPRPSNPRNYRVAMISGQGKEPWRERGTLWARRSGGDGAQQRRSGDEDRKLDRSGRARRVLRCPAVAKVAPSHAVGSCRPPLLAGRPRPLRHGLVDRLPWLSNGGPPGGLAAPPGGRRVGTCKP